jgi:glutamate/tyrosine decarboxylase-like PLP-dependent enzyme
VSTSLPGGQASAAIKSRLQHLADQSDFDRSVQNLFDEGPHLVSTPETPWGDEARQLAIAAYVRFIYGENWFVGAGYRQMEQEMSAWLGTQLGEPAATGLVTAGGTESNLVALLSARQLSGRTGGSVVLPSYSHYSHFKACALFNLEPITVQPANPFSVVDANAVEAAIRPDTVALMSTAGTFGTGWVDPIEDMARIANDRNIPLHVDACCGGFILPFKPEEKGNPVPGWDFTCPGVTSISVDFHKNGMSPPPASIILFRAPEHLAAAREVSPPSGGLLGTRAGGPVAGAWTMMQALGVEGYRATTRCCLRIRDELKAIVESFPDLSVVPGSYINFVAIYSDSKDLLPVWSRLRAKGWALSHAEQPVSPTLFLCTLPQNHGCADRFGADLDEAMKDAPPKVASLAHSESARTYGGVDGSLESVRNAWGKRGWLWQEISWMLRSARPRSRWS